jgi:hypothetical protein
MADLPLSLALTSVLAAAVAGGNDRHLLLAALAADGRVAPVVPLRRPTLPAQPGPHPPRAA